MKSDLQAAIRQSSWLRTAAVWVSQSSRPTTAPLREPRPGCEYLLHIVLIIPGEALKYLLDKNDCSKIPRHSWPTSQFGTTTILLPEHFDRHLWVNITDWKRFSVCSFFTPVIFSEFYIHAKHMVFDLWLLYPLQNIAKALSVQASIQHQIFPHKCQTKTTSCLFITGRVSLLVV